MLCREHGQQLTELHTAATTTTNDNDDDGLNLNGFDLFGIIKETGVVRDVNFLLLCYCAIATVCCLLCYAVVYNATPY